MARCTLPEVLVKEPTRRYGGLLLAKLRNPALQLPPHKVLHHQQYSSDRFP
ncbi:MAG: hypothetical protein NZ703_06715 [Gemmataceae bacterium]|nr:hypothetical protein [Gemmataceae bacterium]MCS7270759.1 hypothetical protein [Gemmataceae bacterium]MDW8243412.1 hypothetical protein [Thermogemmata sp.]